jgi:hypothetical protein
MRPEWQDMMGFDSIHRVADSAVSLVPLHHCLPPLRALRIHSFVLPSGPQDVAFSLIMCIPAFGRAKVLSASILLYFAHMFLEPSSADLTSTHCLISFPRRAPRASTRDRAIDSLLPSDLSFMHTEFFATVSALSMYVAFRLYRTVHIALSAARTLSIHLLATQGTVTVRLLHRYQHSSRCHSRVNLVARRPNQAMQPTAGRRAASLSMTKTRPLQATCDLASGG